MVNASKDYIHQRICIFAGQTFDPDSDAEVEAVLRRKFDIRLPQRRNMNESLASTKSDHEIIELILKYRAMT